MARAPWKAIAVVALLVAAGCPSSPRDEAPSGAGGKGGGGADAQGTSGTAGHGAGAGGAGGDGAGGATAAGSSGAGGGGAGGATATGSGGAGGGGAGGATATGSGGAAGGGAGGGGSWRCPALGDPCSTCLSLQCQESYCACLQNPECAALSNCLLGCDKGDARCAELCSAAHAPGAFDASLESACAAERCRVQCPSRLPLSGCRACRFTHCAEEMRACFASAPCMALLECVDACGADDAACRSACEVDHADGAQAAQAVLACGQDPCDGACR